MKTKNRWSKGIAVMALVLAVTGLASKAQAATQSSSIDLTVRVDVAISVLLGQATQDFGSMDVNKTVISPAITVTNDSQGLVEDYSIRLTNPAGWSAASTPGLNQYTLQMLLGSSALATAPVATDFIAKAATCNLTATNKPINATDFATQTLAGTGLTVQPFTAAQKMYFRILTPTIVQGAGVGAQSISVTVTAAASL